LNTKNSPKFSGVEAARRRGNSSGEKAAECARKLGGKKEWEELKGKKVTSQTKNQ